jgi:hypothetical protein
MHSHVAQECFCGEPNCVGFIGGKTQTDLGGMDDLYIDALGITEEVEALGLKGSKKRKGKKLDEDFTVRLLPFFFSLSFLPSFVSTRESDEESILTFDFLRTANPPSNSPRRSPQSLCRHASSYPDPSNPRETPVEGTHDDGRGGSAELVEASWVEFDGEHFEGVPDGCAGYYSRTSSSPLSIRLSSLLSKQR